MNFKDYLKKLREEKDMSQNKVAKLLNITQSYYNSIERGNVKNPPSDEIMDRMIELFELSENEAKNFKYLAAVERTPQIILDKMMSLKKEASKGSYSSESIPLFPRISAGIGVIGEDAPIDYISIPGLKNIEDIFSVKVKGDSMEPTIKDRSIIFCRNNSELRNDEVGAFLVNGEAYVKRIKISSNHIALISDNPNYSPIYITPNDEFVTLGKVLKVINDV